MGDLAVKTGSREEFIDITDEVQREVQASGVGEGLCHVFVPHTTCGVTVNEGYDPAVREDVVAHLRKQVPQAAGWKHAEGNSDSHVKSVVVGPSLVLPVAGGRLRLGRWQAVFFCEFDGPRERTVWVTVR
jgi:secondary thiamine-phosphate synthase enzyme